MQELLLAIRSVRHGRTNLLFLSLLATVQFVLALTDASFYLFFSPSVPTLLYALGRVLGDRLGERALLTAAVFFSLCLLALWWYLALGTRRHIRTLTAGAVYYATDTALLAAFSLATGYGVGMADALLHLLALLFLIPSARAAGRLARAEREGLDAAAVCALLLSITPPPEGLAPGTPLADDSPDGEDSIPLRPEVSRRRTLFDRTLLGLTIRVSRSFGLTELSVNGMVYAEQRGIRELAYTLTATVEGHRVTFRLYPSAFYARMILLVDGHLAGDKRRRF